MDNREIRSIKGGSLRSVEADGKRYIEGYAAVYGVLSDYTLKGPRGPFKEKIAPGAFDDSIKTDNIGCYWDHEQILGRTGSGQVTIESDSVGVKFRCLLPDTSAGRDVEQLISDNIVYGCSFGMRNTRYDWVMGNDGILIGTVMEASLFDVGPVADPIYETTSVTLRSIDAYYEGQAKQTNDEYVEFAKRRLRFQEQKSK